MLISIEHNIEAECTVCGESLIITDEMHSTIFVKPCERCLNIAEEIAREEANDEM
jgi:hypothetical protein